MEMQEELFSALQHLCYNKHEVILFHVKDKRMEEAFEFSNRPHLFIDLESGREIKFSPNEIRETYKQLGSQFYPGKLKLRCGQLRIDFVEADIDREFHKVLFPHIKTQQIILIHYLQKRLYRQVFLYFPAGHPE